MDVVSSEERNYAVMAHLSCLLHNFVPGAGFLGPAIVMMTRKDRDFAYQQAVEALNFQITMLIAAIVLMFSLIGAFLLPVLALVALIFPILAAVAASKGEEYRYPLTWRVVS